MICYECNKCKHKIFIKEDCTLVGKVPIECECYGEYIKKGQTKYGEKRKWKIN